LGAVIGHAASVATEATRRGLRWMQHRCPLFGRAESERADRVA
jgi:hypothetical protein